MDAVQPPTTLDAIVEILSRVAPEVDPASLATDRPLREQVDLDSLDWLNLVEGLAARLGVMPPPAALDPGATMAQLVDAMAAARPAAAASATAPQAPIARRLHLADGTPFVLRPITPGDAALEAAFVRGLSPESRFKRFLSSVNELTPKKLRYFTDVDQTRHIAWVAAAEREGHEVLLGVARCVADPDGGACEFAVTVDDACQGSGLAGVLMHTIMQAARAQGLREMYGVVLTANRPMLKLAQQLGFRRERDP